MQMSKGLFASFREKPREAEIISHQLMSRSGMLKKHGAGLYSYLPLLWKSYQKLCQIVRTEFESIDWQEIKMPFVIPAELWRESGRWNEYGDLMARLKDRKQNDHCLGPTHEEVVTDIAKFFIHSYKQLPFCLYQISTKFRDELRPRFGVMRGREFEMLDGYSFHASEGCLKEHYEEVAKAYENILKKTGLLALKVEADTGDIGGSGSHEFQVLANSGEDLIFFNEDYSYAANIEKAETPLPQQQDVDWGKQSDKAMTIVETLDKRKIVEVGDFLKIPDHRTIKTLVYEFKQGQKWLPLVVFISGARELNLVKLKSVLSQSGVRIEELRLLAKKKVESLFKCEIGYLGPLTLDCKIATVFDRELPAMHDAVMGANKSGYHYRHVEPGRDFLKPGHVSIVADIVNVKDGDVCPSGGRYQSKRGIEVGHIFQLGQKYSKSMKLEVLSREAHNFYPYMGCYGIGMTRLLAAAVEQSHDEAGIIWPGPLAPYKWLIIDMGVEKDGESVAFALYKRMKKHGFDVLLDDRDIGAGVKFKDADLYGIPNRLVLGKRSLDDEKIEYSSRKFPREKKLLSFSDSNSFIAKIKDI